MGQFLALWIFKIKWGCTWVLEIMDSSQFNFYQFFGLAIRFLSGENDIA